MKRFALLLITAILSLNCMAQSNDEIIVLNLQQVEFSDTSITKALSSVIQNPPKNSMIPKHLTLDFYQSSLPVDQYFLFLSMFCPNKEDMHQFAYYAVIDDYIFIMPKIPSKYIRILPKKGNSKETYRYCFLLAAHIMESSGRKASNIGRFCLMEQLVNSEI